ncbi:hypothetical protein COHA_005384 [Chlorella ohadii]|uniref:RPA43 OB domain-containing protein n=1 Tax=Chlorella ohadii TaxID=2649997 RepID=A0AAD5DR77_9CHLO|nr:hypothetical protein COHA_005384 [Chlorella ohadii]
MEGLERLRTKFTVDLHPSKLASAKEGVRAHLASLLLRWNEDLEGVLLAFRNERVLTQAATIHPYFPFVRLEVAAEVAVFRPRPGMRLVGTVNKVGADYVGLLVLGVINASVAADQMRPEFRPRLAEHCWVSSKAPRHRLEAGTKVHFDVASVRRHGAFISIAGSLQHPSTGAEGFARPPERKAAGAAAAAAAGRQEAGAQAQGPAQQQQQQQQPEQGKKKKEKKKKDKAAAQQAAANPAAAAQQQQQQPAPVEQQSAGKKAKKSKQQKEQQQAAPPQQANGPSMAAAGAAADGSGKKKKEKKRKADTADGAAAAAGAAANGGAEPKSKKQKHKG